MIDSQSLHRRYLTYLLLFYCVAITFYCWFPLLSSARDRFSILRQTPLAPSHQNTTSPQNASTPNFPHRIWQTARDNLPTLTPDTQMSIQTWMDKNPSHIYTLITAARGLTYVRENYAHRPALVDDFLALQDPVLRADLVRYLVVLHDGGIYTDLDTICLQPISSWIPPKYNRADVGLILGIEGDALGGDIIPGFSHPVQFATWTMAAKPGHFMIESIIDRVLTQLHILAESQNTTIAGVEANYMDVMDTTGPGVFAESIYAGLSQIANSTITSANLTGMTEPRLFGDVLILPITSFGAGLPHSNAGNIDDEAALVQHLFAGSWKGDHPLEESPEADGESLGEETPEAEADEESLEEESTETETDEGNLSEESLETVKDHLEDDSKEMKVSSRKRRRRDLSTKF